MYKNFFNLFIIILMTAASHSFCQIEETESRVPELEKFHEVIYPIWHTAYPSKDYKALRSYVPEVDSLADKIYSADLPGILRDKKQKWQYGIKEFKVSVDEYRRAASNGNDEALLNAAENLHSKYEALVRIIRPVLKEIGLFHQSLYVIYHKYLPEKDYRKIIAVKTDLLNKAKAISSAALPKRVEQKKEIFMALSAELENAVIELNELNDSASGEIVESAVDKIHTRYQKLEALF